MPEIASLVKAMAEAEKQSLSSPAIPARHIDDYRFPVKRSSQHLLYEAGFTIVWCDVSRKRTIICNGQTADIFFQQRKENTIQRAAIYSSPRFIVFLGGNLIPTSRDMLVWSGILIDHRNNRYKFSHNR